MPPQPTQNNNAEIDKALKEFGASSGGGEAEHKVQGVITPQASNVPLKEVEGVQFDTPTYGAIKFYKEKEPPKMVKAVIKYSKGAVKNQKQAEWTLFVFVVVAVGISIYLLFGANARPRLSAQDLLLTPNHAVPPLSN